MSHDTQNGAKISGYLEKKGKLRMVSSWKKYWFVLEGRLLLYYRSRAEYEAISPCKGSITLGPPCNIKPALASTCVFQIETRANTITLRAENRYEQDKWMHAILGALNQTSNNPTKMSHFRYSADDLVPTPTSDKKAHKPILARQNTMPQRLKVPEKEKPLLERLQSLGAHSYGESQDIIDKINRLGSPKLPKNENLKKLLKSSSTEELSTQLAMYATIDKAKKEDTINGSVMVENSDYCALNAVEKENRESIIVENDQYAKVEPVEKPTANNELEKDKDHIYQEIKQNNSDITIENLDYYSIDAVAREGIYTVPNLDHNENNMETTTYAEPIYRDSKIYEVPFIAETKIYEEHNVEPDLPPRPKHEEETSSQDSNEIKPKKTTRLQKLAKLVSDSKKDGLKRGSFVIRVLKKMRKQEAKEEDEGEVGEKAPGIKEKADDKILILNQLQKLLNDKKHIIEEKSLTNQDREGEQGTQLVNKEAVASAYDIARERVSATNLHSKHRYEPEYEVINTINIPRPKLLPKSKKQKRNSENCDEKLKTIDEILDDLDNEEQNTRQTKVKHLIEKFNDNCEEVELRQKNISAENNLYNRHSDDLNELLAELSKVTNAPILTPGATSSLVTTPLSDEEWINLIPIRKRRLSEPDYDIPRPHSSLQILETVEKRENAMEPTRFFGPVLMDQERNRDANDKNVSITPDSLEIEQLYDRKPTYTSSIEEDRSLFSYTSHNYAKEIKTLDKNIKHDDFYSRPKSLISLDNPKNECEHTLNKSQDGINCNVNLKCDEYQDSLEPSDNSEINA